MNVKIYTATHLEPVFDLPVPYQFILTGDFKKEDGERLGYITHDSVENNISYKNKYYSEISALYSIKVMVDNGVITSDFLGLTHYRRFFVKDKVFFKRKKETTRLLMRYRQTS
ncbi:DUF4422 domain-containing protein [Marinomonas sp. GJ51-6]|uniref:DUF4422 domain-containing protein n=1 Tax=Marinomonas sp. GJ51-6 TaxID=2992802 RepID=UPI002934CB29|nr:DUF4422 domain-containing protein [Marinomonas sp. GJ51-6]WOD06222.1 DUF4422 domain-containing protein [Marinomonas sp. GJ51-6]